MGAHERIVEAAMRLFAERGTTHLSVRELAQAADVARGTIYNNFSATDRLYDQIAAELAKEMIEQIDRGARLVADPAQRVANGIRHFVKKAHEQPNWGKFVLRFGFSNDVLRGVWTSAPARDLGDGVEMKRFHVDGNQIRSVAAMMSGCVLAAIFLVVEGHKSWREAGADAAEFVLRAVGLDAAAARSYAESELPELGN
jgi:AcrR family transcriptional regulator